MRTLRPCLVALILGAPACAPGTYMEAPTPAPRPVAVQPEAPASRRKMPARRPAPAKTPAKPPVSARAPAKSSSRVPTVDSTALELAVTTRHALDSNAVSVSGAVGLMQVMPTHAGSYGCASADLRTVDANICHGARILHIYLVRTRSVPRALRRYNGCVSGTVTPGCQRYPLRVLRTAARIRRELLSETREM